MLFPLDGTSEVVFESTGARTWVSCGHINIDDDGELSTGEDCSFHMEIKDTNGETRELLPAERVELADHMIALWTRFKEQPT